MRQISKMNQSNFNKDFYERKIKLISTFRINMEDIRKWCDEAAFFHQDLYEDCKILQSKIDESIQSLLSKFDQKDKLEIVASELNEISQENQIFSQVKFRLKTIWEKEKNENNYPINAINDILNDENIISRSKKNITEQDINIAKDKIVQVFNPLQSDIDSIEKIFYNEFKTIANILKNIKNININNNYNYNNDKIMKTQIYDDVIAKFVPTTSIFNLYVSINAQQKFLPKFKEEIDKISIEEAKENISQPIIKPPSINNPSFMQPIENVISSSFNNNDNFHTFGQNDFGHQKSLRDSIKNTLLFKQEKSIEPNILPENENLKMDIFYLKQTVEQLQKENKKLKEQIKSLKEELSVNESIINDLAEGNEEMQDEISVLKEKNDELQTENDNLRSFVENLE